MIAADHLLTEETMALSSFIILHTVLLMAAAEIDCNHRPTEESDVSSGVPGGRIECSGPYQESLCLRVGTESGAVCPGPAPSEAEAIEDPQRPVQEKRDANISGTVTDENGDVVPDAEVVLDHDGGSSKTTSNDTGFFEFRNVRPGDSYRLMSPGMSSSAGNLSSCIWMQRSF
jgi:hypothetical protein